MTRNLRRKRFANYETFFSGKYAHFTYNIINVMELFFFR